MIVLLILLVLIAALWFGLPRRDEVRWLLILAAAVVVVLLILDLSGRTAL